MIYNSRYTNDKPNDFIITLFYVQKKRCVSNIITRKTINQ